MADILSVRPATEQEPVLRQLAQALRAMPFRPFQIRFCNGIEWTIGYPCTVLLTKECLYLAEGQGSELGHQNVRQISTHWIDRIELLPSEAPGSNS